MLQFSHLFNSWLGTIFIDRCFSTAVLRLGVWIQSIRAQGCGVQTIWDTCQIQTPLNQKESPCTWTCWRNSCVFAICLCWLRAAFSSRCSVLLWMTSELWLWLQFFFLSRGGEVCLLINGDRSREFLNSVTATLVIRVSLNVLFFFNLWVSEVADRSNQYK